MFTFEPDQLRETVEKVQNDHPETFADYESPQFASTDFGKRLARRLEETPKDQLDDLIADLSPLERSLYCGLLHHDMELIRRRTLYGLTLETELADIRHLWKFFEQNFGTELTSIAAAVLVGIDDGSAELEPPQLDLCRAIVDGDDPLGSFWQRLEQMDQVADHLESPSLVTAGTSLSIALDRYFFHRGWPTLWQAVPPVLFERKLEGMTTNQVVETIIQGWRINEHLGFKGDAPWLDLFLEKLGVPRSTLWQMLADKNSEAAGWYKNVRIHRELHSFFERFSDNERLDFWKEFVPELDDVRADERHLRVFLDFGAFGFIEFAEKGNATYVYEAEDFRALRKKNFAQRPRLHAALKHRERSIERLTHQGHWQRKFRRKINHYLRRSKGK